MSEDEDREELRGRLIADEGCWGSESGAEG